MLFPLVPAIVAAVAAITWLVLTRKGHSRTARQVIQGASAIVVLVVLVLPTRESAIATAMSGASIVLSWDGNARLSAVVMMLATFAHQVTPREERRVAPEALLVAMALLCLAADNAFALALSMGLLCITITWVESALPADSRGPFAVLGLGGILASLGLLGLLPSWGIQQASAVNMPSWTVLVAVFALCFGGLLLGYPALRWPTMASLTVTAAHTLQHLGGAPVPAGVMQTFLLVFGGIAVLGSALSVFLWGPRGRALDALYGLTFGLALLAAALNTADVAGTATLALLGAVLAYSTLIALEGAEGHGWYALPRIVGVSVLAGLLPGPTMVARWRVVAATLALGDGWLVFWQVFAALLACWVAAMLVMPWAREPDRTSPPIDWVAWATGALLSALSLALGIAPSIIEPGMGFLGFPKAGSGVLGMLCTLAPALLGLFLAIWPAAIHAQRRASSWRGWMGPVWQGTWERALLWIDGAQAAVAESARRLFHMLEERLIIIWGLLSVLVLVLIALESGL